MPSGTEGARERVRGRGEEVNRCRSDFPGCPWLGIHTANAAGVGSILGQGTNIPYAMQCVQTMNNNNK